ncbi:MAG: lysophospholipase [Dehalococcoidales bacterium]|nr:lysophospholipase [Dehalococcoidales bacterium]
MIHKEGNFPGFQKTRIYFQYWRPEAAPCAVLILIHGLGDHSSRFENFVDYFTSRNYAVAAIDLRGHGKSGGIPGYVEKFADYLADLNIFFEQVKRDFKGSAIFLVGHSIGGTIATSFAVSHQEEIAGLLVSCPVLKPGDSITRRQILMARWLSAIFPRLGIAPLEAAAVSRTPEVVEAYMHDPLVYHGKISARLGTELINAMERDLPMFIDEIMLPVLIMYGSEDKLSNPVGCQYLYDGISSDDKTLKVYEGLYHEIFNEPEQQQVFADVATWLEQRV